MQLRLLANLYDVMVAVARKIASPAGELFNEVPDRISDPATLIGFGYAAGADVHWDSRRACVALFLAYLRAQGKVAGAHQEFCGPMAKQQRMATVTIAALICALPATRIAWSVPKWALAIIVLGGAVTAVRRLRRIAAALRSR